MGLDAARGLLACPVCAAGLEVEGPTASCREGHSFDVARHGHLNLLGSAQPANADTAAMVEARARVLASGAFDAVDEALAHLAAALPEFDRLIEAAQSHFGRQAIDATPPG